MSELLSANGVVTWPSLEEMRQLWREVIEGNSHFLVICHACPDGDAIGSLNAVGGFLEEQGKAYTLVVEDGMDERFGFLPQSNLVTGQLDPVMIYDLIIMVDCSDLQRIGRILDQLPNPCPPIVQIDHHITNVSFGRYNLVAPKTPSTCELLYELFIGMSGGVSADVAMNLLTGIVTDTQGFRIPNVTPRTLEVAAELMQAGADLPMIMMNCLNLQPFKRVELWRVMLNNMRFQDGLVWTTATMEERQNIGCGPKDGSGLSSILGNVEEATMSAVFSEIKPNVVTFSFRSRPNFDVAKIAFDLGGGGHPQAAGCTFQGTLEDAVAHIVPICLEEIARYHVSRA